jgi:hypothetical protein
MFQTIAPSARRHTYTEADLLEIAWCREVYHTNARGSRASMTALAWVCEIHATVQAGWNY